MSTMSEDFATAPLMPENPVHLMTEAELREYTTHLHTLRQSFQTFKATCEANEAKQPSRKVPSKVVLEGMEDLL